MNIIEIEGLEKSFDIGDSKVKILKDINVQIQKGRLCLYYEAPDRVKRLYFSC